MAGTTSRNKKNDADNRYRPNLWGSLRDVCITSINKGQFPLVGAFLIFALIIYRLPQNDLSILVSKLFSIFYDYHAMGWFGTIIFSVSWWANSRFLRKTHSKEMSRISEEKTKLQEELMQKRLNSSNKQ